MELIRKLLGETPEIMKRTEGERAAQFQADAKALRAILQRWNHPAAYEWTKDYIANQTTALNIQVENGMLDDPMERRGKEVEYASCGLLIALVDKSMEWAENSIKRIQETYKDQEAQEWMASIPPEVLVGTIGL